MKQKYLLTLGLVFLLLAAFQTHAAYAAEFTLLTRMGEASVLSRGTVDFSGPEKLEIVFTSPVKTRVLLQDATARAVRDILDGKRSELGTDVTVHLIRSEPLTLQIDFPHEASMAVSLANREPRGKTPEGKLYSAVFHEPEKKLPFVLFVGNGQAAMFSTSLIPLGWVELRDKKPGKITRVIPDSDAELQLKRLAEVLRGGKTVPYKGSGWHFECSPLEME